MRLFSQRIAWACILTLAFAMPSAADEHEGAAEAEAVAEAAEEAVADVEEAAEEAAEAVEEIEEAAEEAAEEVEEVEEAAEEAAEEVEEAAAPGLYEGTGLYLAGMALYAYPLEKSDLEDANNASLGADKTNVDDSWGFSGRLGYRVHKHVGIEGEFDMLNNVELDSQTGGVERKTEIRVFHATANAKGYILTGRFQPFVMAGGGWGRSVANPDGGNSTRDDGFVGRVGGGIDIYGSRDVALTSEVSYLFAPGLEDLDHVAFKLGLLLRFFGD